jgi:hypothetical protein
MHYRYQPYPYYRRYYNLNPYYYGRYYSPYYNYQQNIIDSQVATIDQNMVNFGDMTDVTQDANIYQLRTPAPENVGVCTEPPTVEPVVEPVPEPEPVVEPPVA